MSWRAGLEQRRSVLNKMLGELYTSLTADNGKLEELQTEYDLLEDHVEKLSENIDFLRKEAQVVKLKEYKIAIEAHEWSTASLHATMDNLEELRESCQRKLNQTEAIITEMKQIDATLAQSARIYQFTNDSRRDQDAD